jgi:hypothetical protein
VIWRRFGLIVVVGVTTGVLTQVGQSALPAGWSQAANAITPWLLVAFLLGSRMPDVRWAAAAGIAALLFALVGYYGMTELRYGIGGGAGSLVLWGLGALVGGPVFGVAGRWWRTGTHRQRAMGIGLLAAVAIAEGIYHAAILGDSAVGAGFIVAGLLVPLILGRSSQDRIGGYVATVPALALGALGYLVFGWLNGLAASL